MNNNDNIINKEISYFNAPASNTKPNRVIKLFEVVELVRSDRQLFDLTKELRTLLGDVDRKKAFKRTRLPYVTFCGTFHGSRSNANIDTTSNLMCIDIDSDDQKNAITFEDIEPLKERLSADPDLGAVVLFRSPSGNGLKVVVSLADDVHDDSDIKRAFSALEYYFKSKYDIVIDKTCKDVSRPCFLCSDPDIRTTQNKPFKVAKWTPRAEQKKTVTHDDESFEMFVKYNGQLDDYSRAVALVEDIERQSIDITANYNDWVNVGFALADLGENGRSLYHRVSRFYPEYDPQKTDEQFDRCSRHSGQGINLDSVFAIARNNGVHARTTFEVRKDNNLLAVPGTKKKNSPGAKNDTNATTSRQLTSGSPVILVDSTDDALSINGKVKNVISLNAGFNDAIVGDMVRYQIDTIIYAPDVEINERGVRNTDKLNSLIRSIRSKRDSQGEHLFKRVLIADIAPINDTTNVYTTVESFVAEKGADAFIEVIDLSSSPWVSWSLCELINWAMFDNPSDVDVVTFRSKFMNIVHSCDAFEREDVRKFVLDSENVELFGKFGINERSLDDVEQIQKDIEYKHKISAVCSDLTKEIKSGCNPVKVASIINKAVEYQDGNTRAEWNDQINRPFDDLLSMVAEQPDPLESNWRLAKLGKNGNLFSFSSVEFYPSDVTIVTAPTSHGKTAFLFNSVLDLIENDRKKDDDKTYIYVSCEESERQLIERALCVFIDIPQTENGKDEHNQPCFISGLRKRAIKSVLTNRRLPDGYIDDLFGTLTERIKGEIERYRTEVAPRLKFVHTDASIESIRRNLLSTIDTMKREGINVGGVLVDYAQLLYSDDDTYNRTNELKIICKALKAVASATELPFIIGAQLQRSSIQGNKNENGLDNLTTSSIGESADIERIAHDVYFLWKIDKTPANWIYKDGDENNSTSSNQNKLSTRTRRLVRMYQDDPSEGARVKMLNDHLYIERIKARDGVVGVWGLLRCDWERGKIRHNDFDKMKPYQTK